MLNMSVKTAAAPREGTASAVREAAARGVAERATSPARPKRRAFAAEYKLRIVREADAALASGVEGAVGELLRREGLYSSHLTEWRKQRDSGSLAGLAAKKRGPKSRKNPLADENAKLKRELERTKAKSWTRPNTVIDVQKKSRGPAGGNHSGADGGGDSSLGGVSSGAWRLDIKSGQRS